MWRVGQPTILIVRVGLSLFHLRIRLTFSLCLVDLDVGTLFLAPAIYRVRERWGLNTVVIVNNNNRTTVGLANNNSQQWANIP